MRFFGEVGYGESVETPPGSGVWKDTITEQRYYGDVPQQSRQLTPRPVNEGFSTNEDIIVNNQISIVADQYAVENFTKIKYVRWLGTLWIVTNVVVDRPRLILSLGSVYNGPTP